MKCDELKYEKLGDMMPLYPRSTLVIRKQFVDASIAELKDENRRLKRALWIARAERAKEMCQRLLIQGYDPKWENIERKCRAKAEEYK